MLPRLSSRLGTITVLLAVLSLSCLATSCGGGGGGVKEMILVELQFLDRSLNATAPTGTQSLPRNAVVGLVFSEVVNPGSVNNQTIQLRFGATFQSVPDGSFQISGNTVLFDPTTTAQGQPNPPGFDSVTQYIVDIPGVGEQSSVVENIDADPNLTTFFTQFTTSDGWLRELRPPLVLDVIWAPEVDQLTGNIPGNGILGVVFDEAMDPASFVPGAVGFGNIDIRYTDAQINIQNSVANTEIDGTFTPSPDWRTYWFKPTFSWGQQKLVFAVQAFQGLTDLSGNLLVNPRSFGPYTCDGTGIATGKVVKETFIDKVNMDPITSNADWGDTEEGVLNGQPVTSRQAYIYSYAETTDGAGLSGRGQYAPIVDPLTGADLNNFLTNINPPTKDGRRVMWSFAASKIGQKGSITAVAWGPDSNATFAAYYKDVDLALGYQKQDSLALAPSFSGNFLGSPTKIYSGEYSVTQAANVGDTPGEPKWSHAGGYAQSGAAGSCVPTAPGVSWWNEPLFGRSGTSAGATGWYDWPALTTFFEWDPQGAPDTSSVVLIFDANVSEGDSFQQIRGWYGTVHPCNGFFIGGLPFTRMYAEKDGDSPNPQPNLTGGIANPEPSITDTCFTITRRLSTAQSYFFVAGAGDDTTFGDLTNYRPAELTPSVQSGGALIELEFQGCDAFDVDPLGNQVVNRAAPFTADTEGEPTWVKDINLADGMQNIRFRINLISNLISLATARLTKIVIPMTQD